MLFSRRIKEIRLKNNYTQQELGELLGVSKASICGYEKGTRTPTLNKLLELADILNVDFSYLLGNDKYIVADENNNYGINISQEEINLIKKIRTYPKILNLLLSDFDRSMRLIETKLKEVF